MDQFCCLSPDGKILASASFYKTIKLWDWATGQCKGCLKGHQGPVSALVFSPNSKFVVSLAVDQTIRLWNVHTQDAVQVIDSDGFLF